MDSAVLDAGHTGGNVTVGHQLSVVPRQQEECFFVTVSCVAGIGKQRARGLVGQVGAPCVGRESETLPWRGCLCKDSVVSHRTQHTVSPLVDRSLERSVGPHYEELWRTFC